MAVTRSSARNHDSEAPAPQDAATGEKHKREESQETPHKIRGKRSNDPRDSKAGPSTATEATAEKAEGRASSTPSNFLEKGIIYFFFRGRVNVDNPSGISDIARSYIILRPVAEDAKIGDGPIRDAGSARLIAIPKKTLPQSGRDRWTAFIEKSGVSFPDLKDTFLSSSDYVTKTAGERHTPAASPVAEGVYAITKTGRESHLMYLLSLPEKLGEVQKEIGLKEKGSFVITTKNPEYPSPPNARLPKPPDYPEEVQKEFGGLRWMPSLPKHLDYPNTQFLMVGESSGIEKAAEPQEENGEEGEDEPKEEMEKLEEEDLGRMKSLGSSDSERIFKDLQTQTKGFPKLQTTF